MVLSYKSSRCGSNTYSIFLGCLIIGNFQAAVDEEHKLVVATHTINRNDKNALYAISKEAKDNIEAKELTVLADKGYHTGKELQAC